MPIFSRGPSEEYGDQLRREQEDAEKRARKQRSEYQKELDKENRYGGRPKGKESKPDARDEEDIQHLRGWLQGGAKGKPVLDKLSPAEKRKADRMQRDKDRADAERSRKEQRRAAQQSATQDKRQARQALEAANKDINKTKNENIKGYADKGRGRKIENERARLNKKYGQGSKQAKNFDKKNPPPAPKKKGFWS